VAPESDEQRADLAERIITAEQDERRRLAIFLHDGPVQHLSGIALMLDAALGAIEDGRPDDARTILAAALDRHRATIRELRELSFNIEPVVLRDQGFSAAVRGLADQIGLEQAIAIELDVDRGDRLGEKVQVGLYQIIRESLSQAIRRGPPNRIAIVLRGLDTGGLELLIEDDGSGERRKASLDSLGERARTLNARFSVEQPPSGGTRVQVVLPAYAAGET
jgi:two-component system sensor histidine kinase UhpB